MVFLNNILFRSLLYCKNTPYNTCNNKIHVNQPLTLSVRLPVEGGLLVVKFFGEPEVIHVFSTVCRLCTPNPHIVQGSTRVT